MWPLNFSAIRQYFIPSNSLVTRAVYIKNLEGKGFYVVVQVRWNWIWKIGVFQPISRIISETIQCGHSGNGRRIGGLTRWRCPSVWSCSFDCMSHATRRPCSAILLAAVSGRSAAGSPGLWVFQMFLPPWQTAPREIYASGGGLPMAPVNTPRVLLSPGSITPR